MRDPLRGRVCPGCDEVIVAGTPCSCQFPLASRFDILTRGKISEQTRQQVNDRLKLHRNTRPESHKAER